MSLTRITDWDDAYANAPYIKGGDAFPARWAEKANAFRALRQAHDAARLDIAYGGNPRETFDLFTSKGPTNGLVVFVHGGYWRAFEKSDWSHLAAGAVARGFSVAIPSYSLAPQASLPGITAQVTRVIQQASGLAPGPIYLIGHSAGGHLVTRIVCANSTLSKGVGDRVQRVMSISGIHDLRPLLKTAINRDLRLDFAQASAESPALQYPREGVQHIAWVGGAERPEFIRQSSLIASIWVGCGAATTIIMEPGKHHYDVIEGLENPDSEMLSILLDE